MSRITALRATNFKRLSSLDIRTDRALVILGGRNAQGKSSGLDAITVALTGTRAMPEDPIKHGENESEILVELDGATVTRTITRKDGGGYGGTLKIRTADGGKPKKARAWLNDRLGHLTRDPLEFLSQHHSEQSKRLRDIVGIDTTDLDVRRATTYQQRLDIGRDRDRAVGALESMPFHRDLPKEPVTGAIVSASALLAELAAATATERAVVDAENSKTRAESARVASLGAVDRAEAEVRRLLAAVEDARADVVRLTTEASITKTTVVESMVAIRAASNAVIPSAPISARIAALEATNDTAREEAADTNLLIAENARRAVKGAEAQELIDDYETKNQAIDAIDAERAAMLAAATFPVKGLSFDSGGGVTYLGVPLEQASGAEKIRVSMAIALSGDPEIRVVLIRDASLLDSDSVDLIVSLAEEADAQVWLERVGDADEGVIVIEDGGVQ